MPLTLQGLQSTCYDPINFTPRTLPTAGVAGNIIKYDPTDQVVHAFAPLVGQIQNIKFTRVATGDSYYLPFQSDGITSVALADPPSANFFEPTYFFTIRLTACAIFVDQYQPTAAAGFTTPTGAADLRPRLIISHANAAAVYGQEVTATGINVGANPTWFPFKAMTTLGNIHNAAIRTYPGVVQSRRVLIKSEYNQIIKTHMDQLAAQGCQNIQYGATTIVAGLYQPGGWRFYYQTWGAFDYDKGRQQVRDAGVMTRYRVLACQQFYP